jgi:CubicO group peptidase (beta-lactamase class C family)
VNHVLRKAGLTCAFLLLSFASSLAAQNALSIAPQLRSSIDEISQQVLKTTGVPSASVAVVQDGKIAYAQAYGDARLNPAAAATPPMLYSIGSISKQFTAAAVLMLAQEGKLSLDELFARGNELVAERMTAKA